MPCFRIQALSGKKGMPLATSWSCERISALFFARRSALDSLHTTTREIHTLGAAGDLPAQRRSPYPPPRAISRGARRFQWCTRRVSVTVTSASEKCVDLSGDRVAFDGGNDVVVSVISGGARRLLPFVGSIGTARLPLLIVGFVGALLPHPASDAGGPIDGWEVLRMVLTGPLFVLGVMWLYQGFRYASGLSGVRLPVSFVAALTLTVLAGEQILRILA
jgi:hypothetical protein